MAEPIAYTLRFTAPQNHLFDVEARVPTGGRAEVELMLPVWSPGSYLVREFSRNLEGVRAADEAGRPLAIDKVAKNRWRVATGGSRSLIVTYRVYARELSVRTNFVDSGFALVNGPATYLTLKGGEHHPYRVEVVPPAGWKTVVSPLAPAPAGSGSGPLAFTAADYDELVDSPLYAGNGEVLRFTVAGRELLLVNEGGGGVWDGPRAAADAERVVRQAVDFWGVAPYRRYVIFNLMTESGGGLEHKESTVLMTSRFAGRTREGYLGWLELLSHEHFHAWNVKRLRPAALGPFDYEAENYTRDLWVAEGFTDYYGDLLVRRAGLASRKEYLKDLSDGIVALQTTPGRLTQPVGDASFDAWIKFYRRDENSANSSVSYYTKGAVIAFLLDGRIRHATAGRRSLDDVLRLAYERYTGPRGYTSAELRKTISEVAGTDLAGWLALAVDSTEELDYTEALDWYGLRFADKEKSGEEKAKAEEDPEEKAAWLGAETEAQKGQLLVTEVKRGTPAYAAGLNVGDELLAIGDYRVPPEGLGDRLKAYRPGDRESLLIARRGQLLRLPVVFGDKPAERWHLEVSPTATAEQKAHLEAWLGRDSEDKDSDAVRPKAGVSAHR